EQLAASVDDALRDHANGTQTGRLAYAVVGTFGSGKTQLLFHVYRRALAIGILPIYVLAEHLFEEILHNATERVWLPSELTGLVRDRIACIKAALVAKNESELK